MNTTFVANAVRRVWNSQKNTIHSALVKINTNLYGSKATLEDRHRVSYNGRYQNAPVLGSPQLSLMPGTSIGGFLVIFPCDKRNCTIVVERFIAGSYQFESATCKCNVKSILAAVSSMELVPKAK